MAASARTPRGCGWLPAFKYDKTLFRDVFPQFLPDGEWVAFCSSRNGSQQIWTANRDGSQSAALTTMSGTTTGSPLWSPNGQQLVFDSDAGGAFHIYEIGADGGRPRQAESGESYFGSWSHAGRWIYFSSNRSGREQAWKLPAGGGALRR